MHLLRLRPELDKLHGNAPEEWLSQIGKAEQKCYWFLTITPSPWTHLRERTRINLEQCSVLAETGIWVEGACIKGYMYGTDGSCGNKNTHKRFRPRTWNKHICCLVFLVSSPVLL